MPKPVMKNTEIIKQLAGKMFQGMNTGDFSAFENEITPDIAFDFPGVGRTEGSRRTLLLLKALRRKFPNLQFNITDIIAESDRACVVWTNKGNDTSGNPYENSGVTLIHLVDGKISFISDYFKDTTFTLT